MQYLRRRIFEIFVPFCKREQKHCCEFRLDTTIGLFDGCWRCPTALLGIATGKDEDLVSDYVHICVSGCVRTLHNLKLVSLRLW